MDPTSRSQKSVVPSYKLVKQSSQLRECKDEWEAAFALEFTTWSQNKAIGICLKNKAIGIWQ